MSSQIDSVKNAIDLVALIGERVKLTRAGKNYKGLCPFHGEKSPSFFVSPDRGSFYCFGCHAKGDIFTFVQKGVNAEGQIMGEYTATGYIPKCYEDLTTRGLPMSKTIFEVHPDISSLPLSTNP